MLITLPPLPSPDQPSALLAPSPNPSLNETFGAVLVGTFFSLMLYGVTLHQAYRYHTLYSSDRLLLKSAVYSTVILETAHMALSCHTCYFYLVSNFADTAALQHPVRTLQILPVLTGLVIGISQAFFARRAYVFGKQYRIWVSFAVFFLLGEFGFCVVSTIVEIVLTSRGFSAFVPHTWVIATASAMAVCADFILTTVLIIALRRSRSRSGQTRTDSTLDVLVLYTITTGLLTSVSMLTLFLFVVLRPADLIYTALSLVSTKLYANALLASLNSRKSLRDQTYDCADQSAFSIQFVEGVREEQLSRTLFDQSVAIELPEQPKQLPGPCEMEVRARDGGEYARSEGPTGVGARSFDSESRSTLWEVDSLRDPVCVAIAI